MWLPKIIRKKQRGKFKLISLLDHPVKLKSFQPTYLKPKTVIHNSLRIIEKNTKVQKKYYHEIHIHITNKSRLMIPTDSIESLNNRSYVVEKGTYKKNIYKKLPIVQIRPNLHAFFQKGLLEEKNYYKTHPALAKQFALSLLQDELKDHSIDTRNSHTPTFLQAILFPTFSKKAPEAMVHKQRNKDSRIQKVTQKEEVKYISLIEHKQILEEVYEHMERRMKKAQERRGR